MAVNCFGEGHNPISGSYVPDDGSSPQTRSSGSTFNIDPWRTWPSIASVSIQKLSNRPPFDRNHGLEALDGRWKRSLTLAVEKGRLRLPERKRSRKNLYRAIDNVSFRTYHIARLVQTLFNNPNHGNLKDPFLETLYIMLSWRTRTADASRILGEIMGEFEGPADLLKDEGLSRLREIVGVSGFSNKRPEMIVEMVYRFVEKFPNGDTTLMRDWKDDEIIDFLTGISGVGRKSALCGMMYSLERPRFPIDTHVGRVLRRTGMLRELVKIDDKDDHKVLQQRAEFAVPPTIRAALHAGLVSLGQDICRSSNPSCGRCPLGKLCLYNAQRQQRKAEGEPFTHVDLFCGAGGFSAGFGKEGFRTVLAVDFDERACETFKLNHPEMPEGNVQCEDLASRRPTTVIDSCGGWREDFIKGEIDVLTAGIPCQGFSKAGYRSRPGIEYDPIEDPRNHLYKRVLLWVRDLVPKYVVIENVPEIRSAGNDDVRILDAICKALTRQGYRVDSRIVNAHEHDVPQTRFRMIIIASHSSVAEVKVEDIGRRSRKGITVGESLGDLPPLKANEGSWYCTINDGILTSHVARFNNDEDLRIFEAMRPGEHYEEFIVRCEDIMEARRESGKHAVYGIKSFSDKYHRLEPDCPSRTIVAHLNKDGNGYIHPYQPRSITPREAMRLQGFDDDYVFCGSIGKQFIQVGNAIPPPLARDIARALAGHLGTRIGAR